MRVIKQYLAKESRSVYHLVDEDSVIIGSTNDDHKLINKTGLSWKDLLSATNIKYVNVVEKNQMWIVHAEKDILDRSELNKQTISLNNDVLTNFKFNGETIICTLVGKSGEMTLSEYFKLRDVSPTVKASVIKSILS